MFIKSITMKGFRCFGKNAEPISFEKKDGLVSFVGVNGSGKTATLEAMHLLFGSDRRNRIEITEKDFHFECRDAEEHINITAKTEPFFFSVDGLKTESSKGEDKGRKNIIVACDQISLIIRRRKRASNGSVLDNPYIFDKKCIPITETINDELIEEMKKVKGKLDNIVCEITEKDGVRADENISDIIRYVKTLAGCKEQIEEGFSQQMIEEIEENNKKKKIYSLKLTRSLLVHNFHEDNLRFREEDIYGIPRTYYLSKNRTNETKERFSLLADIFQDIEWRERKKIIDQGKRKESIENLHQTFLSKEVEDFEKFLLKHVKEFDNDEGNNNLSVRIFDELEPFENAFLSRNSIPIERLGSGNHILFSFLVYQYLFDQEQKKKNKLILLVDEPEMHLHPQFQKKLLSILKSIGEKGDIFITTHSPYFISPELIGNIFRFENRRGEKGVKIFNCGDLDNLKKLKESSNKIFFFHHRDLFFTKEVIEVIFVEGANDHKYFSSFSGSDENIYFLGGKDDWKLFYKLCQDLEIQAKFVFDLDVLFKNCETVKSFVAENKIEELDKEIKKDSDGKKVENKNERCEDLFDEKLNDYEKKLKNEIIQELRNENIFVLRYGMLENYFDKDGKLIDDENKTEKEKELKEIFNDTQEVKNKQKNNKVK